MKHMNVTIKSVVCGIHLQEDKNASDEVIHWFFKYIPMTEKYFYIVLDCWWWSKAYFQ